MAKTKKKKEVKKGFEHSVELYGIFHWNLFNYKKKLA